MFRIRIEHRQSRRVAVDGDDLRVLRQRERIATEAATEVGDARERGEASRCVSRDHVAARLLGRFTVAEEGRGVGELARGDLTALDQCDQRASVRATEALAQPLLCRKLAHL